MIKWVFDKLDDLQSSDSLSYTIELNGVFAVTHQSRRLNKKKEFKVYIPPDISEPVNKVLFVLHGADGNSNTWIEYTDILEAASDKGFILIFPDGDPHGWYLDSPMKSAMQYESYMMKELYPLIRTIFGNNGFRASICGASMGGHGAFSLGAKYPELFTSISSFFGILKLTDNWTYDKRDPLDDYARYKNEVIKLLGDYQANPSVWEAHSAYELAVRFLKCPLPLLFDCGSEDTATGAIDYNRKMSARLKELNIKHIWHEYPGGHTSAYLNEHLHAHLQFHSKYLMSNIDGNCKCPSSDKK